MSNDPPASNNRLSKYLSEGIILAGLPIAAYVIKFTYDSGYGAFFRIPPTFTSFSLADIFPTIFVVTVSLFFVFNLMSGILGVNQKKKGPLFTIFENIGLLVMFSLIMSTLYPNMGVRDIFLALAAFAVLRHFVLPIAWHRKEKGYAAKLGAHLKKVTERREVAVDYIWDFALFKTTKLLILVVGTISVVYSIGFNDAKTQTQYYVPIGSPSMIVVRFINDNVLLVNIDKDKKLGNQLQFRSLLHDNLTLRRESLGPLRGGATL